MHTDRIDKFIAYLNDSLLTVIPPTLVAWRDGECLEPVDTSTPEIFGGILTHDENQQVIADAIRMFLEKQRATASLFVQECWESNEQVFAPRGSPDRIETVMVVYEELGCGCDVRRYLTGRGTGGIIQLADYTAPGATGRFINLLNNG